MIDTLGNRIKSKFEDAFRYSLPKRTYGLLRVDGKAFHTFTRGLAKPYCTELANALDAAAMALLKEIMGARFAYGQSDEYSFLFTDFDKDKSDMWFDGNIQKIVSVSSSIFTAAFNAYWSWLPLETTSKLATFDARTFTMSSREDVIEYFHWRQADASRNSLNMLAACHFSHKQLMGINSAAKHELLRSKGINWNDCETAFKRGRVIKKEHENRVVSFVHKKTKETITQGVEAEFWKVDHEIPVFHRESGYLDKLVPRFPESIEAVHNEGAS